MNRPDSANRYDPEGRRHGTEVQANHKDVQEKQNGGSTLSESTVINPISRSNYPWRNRLFHDHDLYLQRDDEAHLTILDVTDEVIQRIVDSVYRQK